MINSFAIATQLLPLPGSAAAAAAASAQFAVRSSQTTRCLLIGRLTGWLAIINSVSLHRRGRGELSSEQFGSLETAADTCCCCWFGLVNDARRTELERSAQTALSCEQPATELVVVVLLAAPVD